MKLNTINQKKQKKQNETQKKSNNKMQIKIFRIFLMENVIFYTIFPSFGRGALQLWFYDVSIKWRFVVVRYKKYHKRKSKRNTPWELYTQRYVIFRIFFLIFDWIHCTTLLLQINSNITMDNKTKKFAQFHIS